MAGTSSNQLRSAYVAETTAGTTPATPGFTTCDTAILINATPNISEQKSLTTKGARADQAVIGREVSGTMADKLIYGNYDGWLETLLQGAWASDVLKDGKSVKTMTVENAIAAGEGGTNTMMRYRGVQAVSGSITAAANEDIQFSFDVRGMGSDDATTTAITGATYTDPTNTTPLTSGLDVGTITIAGYTVDCIMRVEMQFEYDDRSDQPKIGTYDLCGITRGALVPVINVRLYVEANFAAMLNAARSNHTAFAVTVPLGSVSGSKYTVEFPSCKFAAGTLDFGTADAMHDVVINPLYDDSEACVVKITRAVA